MKIQLAPIHSTRLATKMISSVLFQIFDKKSRIIYRHFNLLPIFKDTESPIDRYCQNIIVKGKIIPQNKPIIFKAVCLIENSITNNGWTPVHMTLRFGGKKNKSFYRFDHKSTVKGQKYLPIREKRY